MAFLDDLVASETLGVAAEDDVDATTGHVGGDGDGVEPTCLGHDHRLASVLLGVEHLVRHAPLLQQLRQVLALLDADRADQHRLAALVPLGDVVDDRTELRLLALVDEVGLIVADHGLVGGDRHHGQLVRAHQLGRLGGGGTGHPGQLVVHAEVVLQGDRGEGLVLLFDLHTLLGLDGLVDAFAPAAALEHAAGELVDDLHLAALDDVVLVALVQLLGLQGHRQLVHQVLLHLVVEVLECRGPARPVRCRLRAARRRACLLRPRSRRRASASARSRRTGSTAWRRRRHGR